MRHFARAYVVRLSINVLLFQAELVRSYRRNARQPDTQTSNDESKAFQLTLQSVIQSSLESIRPKMRNITVTHPRIIAALCIIALSTLRTFYREAFPKERGKLQRDIRGQN